MPGTSAYPQPRAQRVESTRVRHHRSAKRSGIPRAIGFNGCFVLSLETGLIASIHGAMRQHYRHVDVSIGTSGPHDFAVRARALRLTRKHRPSHLAPNVRDDRDTPLLMGRETAELLEMICATTQGKERRRIAATSKSGSAPGNDGQQSHA